MRGSDEEGGGAEAVPSGLLPKGDSGACPGRGCQEESVAGGRCVGLGSRSVLRWTSVMWGTMVSVCGWICGSPGSWGWFGGEWLGDLGNIVLRCTASFDDGVDVELLSPPSAGLSVGGRSTSGPAGDVSEDPGQGGKWWSVGPPKHRVVHLRRHTVCHRASGCLLCCRGVGTLLRTLCWSGPSSVAAAFGDLLRSTIPRVAPSSLGGGCAVRVVPSPSRGRA